MRSKNIEQKIYKRLLSSSDIMVCFCLTFKREHEREMYLHENAFESAIVGLLV